MLTLDYGVRFYYLTPQWDTTLQASNFLPDKFDPSQAVRLFQPTILDGARGVFDPVLGQPAPAVRVDDNRRRTRGVRPRDRPDGRRALHRARGAGLRRSLQRRLPG